MIIFSNSTIFCRHFKIHQIFKSPVLFLNLVYLLLLSSNVWIAATATAIMKMMMMIMIHYSALVEALWATVQCLIMDMPSNCRWAAELSLIASYSYSYHHTNAYEHHSHLLLAYDSLLRLFINLSIYLLYPSIYSFIHVSIHSSVVR